jgi:hypothetical protein
VVIDYTGTTGFAGEATTSTNNADGYASGTFSGVALAHRRFGHRQLQQRPEADRRPPGWPPSLTKAR